MKVPTLSIVTPSYNQAQYLRATIESVLSQAGSFGIEYFVIDGGSTDGSVDVIRNNARMMDSQTSGAARGGITMEWVSEADQGQTDAINKGLRRATGDFVAYLNSDDIYLPGCFERVVETFLQRPDAHFVYGDGDVIDEVGNIQWEWLSRPFDYRLLSSYHFAWNAFPNYVMQQSTFWRRSVLDRIGYLDETMHYAMDLEYWLRAAAAGLHLLHIPHKLSGFRLIAGTKSLSGPTVFWHDQLEIFRRHHGAKNMRKYFRYFYFNLARSLDYDFLAAVDEGSAVFRQWIQLPADELATIERASQAGLLDAKLLCGTELLRSGEAVRASELVREAIGKNHRWNLSWPHLEYQARTMMGRRVQGQIDALWQKATAWYRRTRIDYRYHESKS